MITGRDVIKEARSWIGVPYRHQGRTRFGVDCIGLVICVRHALGGWQEAMDEVTSYTRRPKDGLLLDKLMQHCAPTSTVSAGVVALIKWHRNIPPSHVALCTGDGNIIHAYANSEKVCEVGYRSQWTRLTAALFHLPGVTYE